MHLPEGVGTQPPKLSAGRITGGQLRTKPDSCANLLTPCSPADVAGEPADRVHSSAHQFLHPRGQHLGRAMDRSVHVPGVAHPLFQMRCCLHKGRHPGKPTQASPTEHSVCFTLTDFPHPGLYKYLNSIVLFLYKKSRWAGAAETPVSPHSASCRSFTETASGSRNP